MPSRDCRRRLLPGRARWMAVVAVPLCLAVTVVLGCRYRGDNGPRYADRVADGALRMTDPALHDSLWMLVSLGDPRIVGVFAALVAVAALALDREEALPLIVLSPLVAALLVVFVLKPNIARTLHGAFAYPSGHTVTISSIVSVVVVLLIGADWPKSRLAKSLLCVGALLFIVAVALALIALGLHYATDTVGGGCLAFGVTFLVALLSDLLAGRGRQRRGRS